MRKLLFTLAFAVIGITASYAQKNERVKLSPEEKADKIAAAMQTKLSLNDDQKSKIRQIELDRIKQQDELRKTDAAAMKGKFEERKAAMKAHDEKIKGVLTAEQQKAYAASKEEMKGKLKDRMRERKGRPHKTPKVEEGTTSNN